MPRAAVSEGFERAASAPPMALFRHLPCEFPLLREHFWPSAASATPAPSPARRASPASHPDGDRGPSTPVQRLPWAAADWDGRSVSPSKRRSGAVSLDLGSCLCGRGSGGPEPQQMPRVPELQRCESVAEGVPRGRLGLRSLDLQVRPCACCSPGLSTKLMLCLCDPTCCRTAGRVIGQQSSQASPQPISVISIVYKRGRQSSTEHL